MPNVYYPWTDIQGNTLILEQLQYSTSQENQFHRERVLQLNNEQRIAYETILQSIGTGQSSQFFLQGSGGCGKTFLYKCICNYYRSQKEMVLCVASFGIAALLLPGGRTSHSRFKIPLPSHSSSTCNISRGTPLAELLLRTKLIIWDEVYI